MKNLIIFSLLIPSLYAQVSKKEYCQQKKNFVTTQYQISLPQNLLSFNNSGGIANGGTCWWHSRFQRNAHYLAFYQKSKPLENNRYYKSMIRRIIQGHRVAEIPGHPNLSSFSRSYQKYIQRQLNKWQLKDGIIKFAWVTGLKGKTKTTAAELKSMMDELYNTVKKQKNITYTKLQVKGISSHAWLVYDMIPRENGYSLSYIDSNWSQSPSLYTYIYGDETINKYGGILMYPEKNNENKKIKRVVDNYCAI